MDDPGLSPYGDGPVPPGAFAPRPGRPPLPAAHELAEPWRRALAVLLDTLVVGAATLLLLAALGAGVFGDGDAGVVETVLGLLLAVVLFAALALLYAPLVMARTNGQTLGKLVTGCRVVRVDGRRVDFGWAAYREVLVKGVVLGVAGALTGGLALLADALWPLVDGQNRALHDLVVDSRVVRSRRGTA